jgi:adenylate kinase
VKNSESTFDALGWRRISTGLLRVVLIAPPGAGKTTQADRLSYSCGVPHVSMGDLLRDHSSTRTTSGATVADAVNKGELVEDALVLGLLNESLTDATGFILDGFPRTLSQAVAAHSSVFNRRPLYAAIEIEVPEIELISRLSRRGTLGHRTDDALKTIHHRLAVYISDAKELLSYYREREISITVDGTSALEKVTECILERLQEFVPRTLRTAKASLDIASRSLNAARRVAPEAQ